MGLGLDPPDLHARSQCSFTAQTGQGSGWESKPLDKFIYHSHDAYLRADPSLGSVPGNTTLASCKKRQVPGWGMGSIQGAGELAPQVARVTGNHSGTERHDEV